MLIALCIIYYVLHLSRKVQALNVIENVTLVPLIEGDKRQIFNYEQTIVVRDLLPNDEVRRCEMIEAYGSETGNIVRTFISVLVRSRVRPPVQSVPITDITRIMKSCDAVDDKYDPHDMDEQQVNYTQLTLFGHPINLTTKTSALLEFSSAAQNIARQIFPQTNWCGRGDIAKHYHDLGKLREVDRCCRAHDHCPIKIHGESTRYGLLNNNTYTSSHCTCDDEFYDCLKNSTDWGASQVGYLYFNILKPPCIQGYPESSFFGSKNSMKLVPARKNW